jgi:hypothetical protein
MALKLMYITNNESIAKVAEDSGVDWVFIDLEINGKEERQGHLDTVISRHNISDVKKIKKVLTKADLLVRINPIYDGTKDEIDRVINDGADIVMLPFFKTYEEVTAFINYINGRVKTCLLLETAEAVENIDSILSIKGIDYIHIGLNDLHLSYGMKFMFELISNGTVEALCTKFKEKDILYGFGGIAQLGKGDLPAETIITEHYRLNSSMAILSRSFCNTNSINNINEVRDTFISGIKDIREFENLLNYKTNAYFKQNKETINQKVKDIVKQRDKVVV